MTENLQLFSSHFLKSSRGIISLFFRPAILIFSLALAVFSSGCTQINELTSLPSPTSIPAPTRTPAQTFTLTPPSTPRWMEYQIALSRGIHPVYPFTQKVIDEGLCEWAILGQDGREVYAWAMCEIKSTVGIHGGSVPVVIQLSETGKITGVHKPDDGTSYRPSIEKLFPVDVQKIIFDYNLLTTYFDPKVAEDRLANRWEDPSIPPMIVEAGIPLP